MGIKFHYRVHLNIVEEYEYFSNVVLPFILYVDDVITCSSQTVGFDSILRSFHGFIFHITNSVSLLPSCGTNVNLQLHAEHFSFCFSFVVIYWRMHSITSLIYCTQQLSLVVSAAAIWAAGKHCPVSFHSRLIKPIWPKKYCLNGRSASLCNFFLINTFILPESINKLISLLVFVFICLQVLNTKLSRRRGAGWAPSSHTLVWA